MEEDRKEESKTPESKPIPASAPKEAPVSKENASGEREAKSDPGLVVEDEGLSMAQALGESGESKPESESGEGRGRRGRGRRGRGRRGRSGSPEGKKAESGERKESAGDRGRGESRGRDKNRGRDRDRGERGRDKGRDKNRDKARDKGRDRDRGRDRERESSRRGRGSGERRQTEAQKGGFKREVYVNGSQEETRVAIVEDDRLVELLWERKNSKSIVGNIYKGTVENVLPGISSAFINIGFDKNAYLYISDVLGDTRRPIDQILKKGQEVMIQVAKEAIGTKGAKVTMDVTLPGRYLVFTPFSQFVGISKHIANAQERKRISEIVDGIMESTLKGKGVVVRTEAEGATKEELEREAKFLMKTWEAIDKTFKETPAPCQLHEDLDVSLQVARDLLTDDVYVYLIDDKKIHENVVNFIENLSPELKNRVRYYDGKTPIFTAFGIEPEIEKIRSTKCGLPSGGSIVIQEAESLCAIDVNTGRFTGSKSQEETVTMTNVEAAQEVAQQLRLRNIGGIVVIDFIDMRKASNRQKVMEALAQAVKRDRAKIRILPITRLGLIEMTRERKRESTVSLMTDECPECMGSGRVLSSESLRIRIQREVLELTQGRPGGNIRLVLHPQLAEVFESKQKIIEDSVKRSLKIVGDANLQWEDYRIIIE
jgi:ribonuclease G